LRSSTTVFKLSAAVVAIVAGLAIIARSARAAADSPRGRIVVLMVWDGLRPDLVDETNTPNLLALERAGVRFAHHHSIYPTLTMVNAAGLATGASPSRSGIYGDQMYLSPLIDMTRAATMPVGPLLGDPLNLEHSQYLAQLNDPRVFDGHLLGLDTTAQEVERSGGFVAVVGKQGPTLLFDDEFTNPKGAASNFMFVADDMATPSTMAAEFAHMPVMTRRDYSSIIARDAWFAKIAADEALPAARLASSHGQPALVVLWQHNPDITQHIAGLGTQPALNALHACDANLATLRAVINALGIADRTDLVIVSDHGFATIKATVPLARLLVAAGLKKSVNSKEVVVAADAGGDWIYLSKTAFPTPAERRQMIQRIVDYAEAQEWSGPIFSPDPGVAKSVGGAHGQGRSGKGESNPAGSNYRRSGYLGSIDGTFSQAAFGLGPNPRAADLIISFREFPNLDNRALTGPQNPAYTIGPNGPEVQVNKSSELVRPMPGVMYADADSFSTGMGMHGAAGSRELHNFCAATGPDFRSGMADDAPTGNADVAPTMGEILGVTPVAGVTGRILSEALAFHGVRKSGALKDAHKGDARRRETGDPQPQGTPFTVTASRALNHLHVTTTLKLTRYAGHDYLDGADTVTTPTK
jgi:Type I phosphodiesterase / nucleotide pyrophosphatase